MLPEGKHMTVKLTLRGKIDDFNSEFIAQLLFLIKICKNRHHKYLPGCIICIYGTCNSPFDNNLKI